MSIHITEYGIIFYHVEGIAGETKLFHFLLYMGVRHVQGINVLERASRIIVILNVSVLQGGNMKI